jgi:hypothetical protein
MTKPTKRRNDIGKCSVYTEQVTIKRHVKVNRFETGDRGGHWQSWMAFDDVAPLRLRPRIRTMQHLELSDEETAALTQELHDIDESDRYPFSPRIRTLRAILAKLRPEPVREPLLPPKVYAPPSKGRYRRRRG